MESPFIASLGQTNDSKRNQDLRRFDVQASAPERFPRKVQNLWECASVRPKVGVARSGESPLLEQNVVPGALTSTASIELVLTDQFGREHSTTRCRSGPERLNFQEGKEQDVRLNLSPSSTPSSQQHGQHTITELW